MCNFTSKSSARYEKLNPCNHKERERKNISVNVFFCASLLYCQLVQSPGDAKGSEALAYLETFFGSRRRPSYPQVSSFLNGAFLSFQLSNFFCFFLKTSYLSTVPPIDLTRQPRWCCWWTSWTTWTATRAPRSCPSSSPGPCPPPRASLRRSFSSPRATGSTSPQRSRRRSAPEG
jgi:hypothetical protein